MTNEFDAPFVAEVLRINDRYTLEVVESFNICPFARGALLADGAQRVDVLVLGRVPLG